MRTDEAFLLTVAQEIENLETLTALEELWLGKNKIVEIKVTILWSECPRQY